MSEMLTVNQQRAAAHKYHALQETGPRANGNGPPARRGSRSRPWWQQKVAAPASLAEGRARLRGESYACSMAMGDMAGSSI